MIVTIKVMIVIGLHKPMNTLLQTLNCFAMFDISLRHFELLSFLTKGNLFWFLENIWEGGFIRGHLWFRVHIDVNNKK